MAAISQTDLYKAYLAYFGRPPDITGLTAFANATKEEVVAAFSASQESRDLYSETALGDQINSIYRNLFNRDAEPAGLTHWKAMITTGRITLADAAMSILEGARGTDITSINNKLSVMRSFVAALDTTEEILGYVGNEPALAARLFIATVDHTDASVTAALSSLTATVAHVVELGRIGQTFVLTDGVDMGRAFTGGEKNDTFIGRVSATLNQATSSTYNPGDAIDGGRGIDTLRLFMESGTTADGVVVKNVENLDLRLTAIGEDPRTQVYMTDWDASLQSIAITSTRSDVAILDQQTVARVSITDRSTASLASSYELGYAAGVLDGNNDHLRLTIDNVNGVEGEGADLTVGAGMERIDFHVADRAGDDYASHIDLHAGEDLAAIHVTGGRAGQAFTLDAGTSNLTGGTFNSSTFAGDMTLSSGRTKNAVFGAGDDNVYISGWADNSDASYDLGAGHNSITVTPALGGTITAAAGDDNVTAGGGTTDTGSISVGNGDNSVSIYGTHAGAVRAGTGDDEVSLFGSTAAGSLISLAGGDNIVAITGNHSGSIEVGNGDNLIEVGGNVQDGDITAGDGNNHIDIAGNLGAVAPGTVQVGNGDNEVHIGGSILNDAVVMGDGNNELTVGGYVAGGALQFGDGNNIVTVGQDITDYVGDVEDASDDVASTVTFGDGDNLLAVGFARDGEGQWVYTSGDDISGNSTVNFGNGNNTVVIQNDIKDSATLNFGTGDNKVYVGDGIYDNATINFAGGNNEVHVLQFYDGCDDVVGDSLLDVITRNNWGDGDIEDNVTINFHGNGNNKLVVDDDIEGKVKINFTGNGDNTVIVRDEFKDGATVTFGNGNNTMTVAEDIEGSSITFGSGNDSLTVGLGDVNSTGDADIFSQYDEARAVIDMGAGNDTVTLYATDSEGSMVRSGGHVDGGAGSDDVLNMLAAENRISLIERSQGQEFELTLDKTYAIGDVVSITIGTETISYTVQASDFTQGITADQVQINVATGLRNVAISELGEDYEVGGSDNAIYFDATFTGPDLTVTSSSGTVDMHQYSDAQIRGFETINLRSVDDGEGEFGDVYADFSLISGVTTAINMDSESALTDAGTGNTVGANFESGHVADFYLDNLSRAESRLLSIEADEVTAEGDHQAIRITIGNGDGNHAIGDEITVNIAGTEVVYTVTAADLAGATAVIDAKNIARSLEVAIAAAAAAAGFSIATSTDNTITLIGSTQEDVHFDLNSEGANDGFAQLVWASADDDNDADVYVNARLDGDEDTSDDTVTLDINGRGNFDLDLSIVGGEDHGTYENVELNVQDAHSHFIDFVDFDTEDGFEQDWTITLTGGAAGEEIYLDNVIAATVDARTSAADLTIRMVGNDDASLDVRTGSGDDTLLMQDSGNEFALVDLDDTIDLGAGYNTLVMDAHNIDNREELRDLEGDDEWYAEGEDDNGFPNAYAAVYPFNDDDDYMRGINVLRDQDFTTTRNVQKLVLGTDGQAEDRFLDAKYGWQDRNSSAFSIDLNTQAHAAGLKDVVFRDNQGGDTTLYVGMNGWENGDDVHLTMGNRTINYTVNVTGAYADVEIADDLYQAILDEFGDDNSDSEDGIQIDELGGMTVTREPGTGIIYFGAIDDGLVYIESYEMEGEFTDDDGNLSLSARNLEDSVIEFGSAYGSDDALSVTTYAEVNDSDVDRLTILNNTSGSSLTVNTRDIDIRDRTIHMDAFDGDVTDGSFDDPGSLQQFLDFILYQDSSAELDNYLSVPRFDPRDDSGYPSDYTDHVSRLLVVGSTGSVDTINVDLTRNGMDLSQDISEDGLFQYPLFRINGESIDAVNLSAQPEVEGVYEFVLDVNNEDGDGVETLTFDASALDSGDQDVVVHIATTYEAFEHYGESTLDASYLSDLNMFEGWNLSSSLFAPISTDRSIVSVSNQANVRLDATGGAGDDFIVGGRYNDIIRGGDGSDFLLGNGGSDTLYAGSAEEGGNMLQGDLVTAENQVQMISFAGNYDEGDVIAVHLGYSDDTDTYSYTVTANGGEAEAESYEDESGSYDYNVSNGALVVNNLRDEINSEGGFVIALDDDEWTIDVESVGATGVTFTVDGRTLQAYGEDSEALAADIARVINEASESDTAQDYLIAVATSDGNTVTITRAISVSDLTQYGPGDLEGGSVVRNDNGTNLFLINIAAGVGMTVDASINNTAGIADSPQIYTITSSRDLDDDYENGERTISLVINGITYHYNPGEGGSTTQLNDIKAALGASAIDYNNDVITITGPVSGASMPSVTQAYGTENDSSNFSASIGITDAVQAAAAQDAPTVEIVQQYFTVHADEQDTLVGGADLDAFLIVKSADSDTAAEAVAAMDTIDGAQLGEGGDVISLGAFAFNVDQLALFTWSEDGYQGDVMPLNFLSGGAYHSYFLDASNRLEIDQVVNFGAVTAMSAQAPNLAAALDGLFAQNNVFQSSGAAATNAAGLFSYGGNTYLVAVGDEAGNSFGADDYIVKLVNFTGTLDVSNLNLEVYGPV